MRDPALAALMGALPGEDFGADGSGGHEADFGAFGAFGAAPGLSVYDPSRNIGYGFGWDYGVDPVSGAAVPVPALGPGVTPGAAGHVALRGAAMPHVSPHPAAVAAAWHAHNAQQAHTTARTSLLDPNQHSVVKIERYSFSLVQALVLNTPLAGFITTLQPNTKIRPQRVVMNAPTPMFVLVASLQVANVNVLVGSTEDAFTYSATAQGVMLDLPTLEPANRATLTASYTGFVPPGFANGFAYTFILTLQGPSTIAGGG
jgi:hypothetical protein